MRSRSISAFRRLQPKRLLCNGKAYLEVTFRKGEPFAAYFYLPRNPGEKSVRTEKAGAGVVIDYGNSGRPVGIEITAPENISLGAINKILAGLNLHPAEQDGFAPLLAA